MSGLCSNSQNLCLRLGVWLAGFKLDPIMTFAGFESERVLVVSSVLAMVALGRQG